MRSKPALSRHAAHGIRRVAENHHFGGHRKCLSPGGDIELMLLIHVNRGDVRPSCGKISCRPNEGRNVTTRVPGVEKGQCQHMQDIFNHSR